MEALYYTILIALIASIIATIIGTITAIGIHNMRGKRKSLLLSVNNLPIINPDIVTGIALMSLFIFLKLTFGFNTMLLAHISFDIPYVILSVLPKLRQLPDNTIEAAMDLGATYLFYAFKDKRVDLLPQIKSLE